MEQAILEQIQTLTSQQQQEVLNFIEFLQYKANKVEIIVKEVQEAEPISFYEAAKEFIGCVDGGPGDLSTNKDYLRGIGR